MKIGKDAIVIGDVSDDIELGEGAIRIGMDKDGSFLNLNKRGKIEIGRGAKAVVGGIAIGVGATVSESE